MRNIDQNILHGVLTNIENMGNEKNLYFNIGARELIMRAVAQDVTLSDIGSIYSLKIDASFCHLFDFYTEENLSHRC